MASFPETPDKKAAFPIAGGARRLEVRCWEAPRTARWTRSYGRPACPAAADPDAPEDAVAFQSDQGERVGVFVDSVAPGRWRVEVVTVRLFALDPAKLDWGEDVFYSMEVRLDPENRLPLPDSAVPPR